MGAYKANVPVVRQNDTTNTTVPNARIETGWGVIAISSGTTEYQETITFSTAFTTAPIILVSPAGDALTAAGTAYGTGANIISANWYAKSILATATNFAVRMNAPAIGNAGYVWYTWIAIGV